MRPRPLVRLALIAAAALTAAPASAIELFDIDGEPLALDVTNTATFNWHFVNRNENPFNPGTMVDDKYGDLIDRFNIQATWWRLRVGARFDAVTYFNVLTPDETFELATEEYENLPLPPGQAPPERLGYIRRYDGDLHTRFLNTYYLAKVFAGYTQPGVDATIGDFYVQLGRGLVFSVRKIDELGIDTTVRGGKLALDHDFGPVRVALMGFGGQINPTRVDETSGRRLHGAGSPLFFGFPTIGDFRYQEFTPDPNNPGQNIAVERVRPSRANYLEDTVVGGRLAFGRPEAELGVNGSMVLRKSFEAELQECLASCSGIPACEEACRDQFDYSTSNPVKAFNTVRTFSGSLNVPSIAKAGDLYVEVAGQQLRDQDESGPDISGYGVYAAGTVRAGPVTGTLEGKHYRRFFPLSANIDVDDPEFAAGEFSIVAYNQVPTAEPIYVEQIGSPNVCMTGGRAKVDFRVAKPFSVYGWLGHYVSYSEAGTTNAETCDTEDDSGVSTATRTWDAAAGTDLELERGKSQVKVWIGGRVTDRDEPSVAGVALPEPTTTFYREGYVRYDLVKHLSGPFAIQLQGFHRRRYEPLTEAEPWHEGENYTGLQWSPHLTAIFGYEYSSKADCGPADDAPEPGGQRLCHFVNGGLQYKSTSHETVLDQVFDTVQVFVGQRRGAVRCVSGVCRRFPPFEGAKLELTSRF